MTTTPELINSAPPAAEPVDERGGWTSASNAEADLLCPARHLAQKGIPRTESKDSTFGDRIHKALALRNPAGLPFEEQETYTACLAIEVQKVREFYGPDADLTKLRYWPETRFFMRFTVPGANGQAYELAHSGKPDRVYRLPGAPLFIVEYKTLAGDVPQSPRNLQVRDQAVICAGHFMADAVGAVVIQPLVNKNPEICLYQAHDIERGRDELIRRVISSNDPRSNRIPGEVQCKFCLARPHCLPHVRWAGAMVPNMLNLLEVPVAAWTPEQRAMFCDRFSVAQKWLNETWDAIEALALKDPGAVIGYGMVEGSEREVINDPQKLFERFLGLGGDNAGFLKCVSVIKGKFREQVSVVTSLKGKKLDSKLDEAYQGIVDVKRNKSSLVKQEVKP